MSTYSRTEIIEAICRQLAHANSSPDVQLGWALAHLYMSRVEKDAPTSAEIDAAIAWLRRQNEDDGMDALILRKLDAIQEMIRITHHIPAADI